MDIRRDQRKQITEAFRAYAMKRGTVGYADMLDTDKAVAQTLSVLHAEGQDRIVAVIDAVYFKDPAKPLHRSDIDERVISYSITHYVSTASIYRWLSIARRIYWAILYHEVE